MITPAPIGICPKCSKTVGHLSIDFIQMGDIQTGEYRGISYRCPHCKTVLGVERDPRWIVDELEARQKAKR